MINIVIPMAGQGSRFSNAGYKKPKPFIDVFGKTMIECVIENLNCNNARFILIGRKEHLEIEKKLISEIKKRHNAEFISLEKLTEGTASTVLYARKYINDENPLLIANSDQLVHIDIQEFINDSLERSLDGSILTFKDKELNPKWSYAKADSNGNVTEVQEKIAISDNATVGIYYFAKGEFFVNSAIDMIIHNDRVNNEFYTCPVYNYMIKERLKVGLYQIKSTEMVGLGTPEDLELYIKNYI